MLQKFLRWPKKMFIIIGCVLSFSALMAARTGILSGILQSDMDGGQFKILNLARVETGTAAVSGKQTINVNSGVTQTTSVATALDVTTGSPTTPITTANAPSVVISRREGNISGGGDGSDGPALYVVNHSAGTQQNVGITSKSVMLAGGSSDVVGMYAQGEYYGSARKVAFGLFAHAYTTTSVGGAIAIETQTTNDGASDNAYSPIVGDNLFIGLDVSYSSPTNKLGAAGIQVRGGPGQWDVGLGFMTGSGIKKAEIQSDSNATYILLANGGTHTNGIDLRGATFSGSPFSSNGFSVGPSGNINGLQSLTLTNASGTGLDLSNGTKVTRAASDGHLKFESQNSVIEAAGALTVTGALKVNNTAATYTSGTGSPETVITAVIGSIYTRTDGGAGTTLYVKESGTGNTGWIAK